MDRLRQIRRNAWRASQSDLDGHAALRQLDAWQWCTVAVDAGDEFADRAAVVVHDLDDVVEVGDGVEVVQARRLGEAQQGGIGFGASNRGAEEAVFAIEGAGAHAAFGVVVVDGGCADVAVAHQAIPAFEGVGAGFADARLRQYRRIGMPVFHQGFDLAQDGYGTLLSDRSAIDRRAVFEIIFDAVQLRDEEQHGVTARTVGGVVEFASDMGPAEQGQDIVAGQQLIVTGVGVAHYCAAVALQDIGDPFSSAGVGEEIMDATRASDGPQAAVLAGMSTVNQQAPYGVIDADDRFRQDSIENGVIQRLQIMRQIDVPATQLRARDVNIKPREALLLTIVGQMVNDAVNRCGDQHSIAYLTARDDRWGSQCLLPREAGRPDNPGHRAGHYFNVHIHGANTPAFMC